MITKEELLQKGIDPVVADEILASMDQEKNSSPLEALKKAMEGDDDMSTLFKAKEGEEKEIEINVGKDDDDDDEMDEEYMKKHMKKYMKKNKKEASEAAEEAGLFGKEMKKAVDDFNLDAEGAVIEMAELSPVLDALVPAIESMAKAISALNSRVEVIAEQNASNFSLMHKAAAVQVETAEIVSGMARTPQGRKGVTIADMSKASTPVSNINANEVYQVLAKAMKAGDMVAGNIGAKFESAGKRFNLLNDSEQKYVSDLIKKEAN